MSRVFILLFFTLIAHTTLKSQEVDKKETQKKPKKMTKAQTKAFMEVLYGKKTKPSPKSKTASKKSKNKTSESKPTVKKQLEDQLSKLSTNATKPLNSSNNTNSKGNTQPATEEKQTVDNVDKFFDKSTSPGPTQKVKPTPLPTLPAAPQTLSFTPQITPTFTPPLAPPPPPIDTPATLPEVFASIPQTPSTPAALPEAKKIAKKEISKASDKNCLQECINFTQHLKSDSLVGSISGGGSKYTLKAAGQVNWVPTGQGSRQLDSRRQADLFEKACSHIHTQGIDPSDDTLYNYNFNNNEPAEECKKHFASIVNSSNPISKLNDKFSEEFIFSDPNPASPVPLPKVLTKPQHANPVMQVNKKGGWTRVNGQDLDPVPENEIAASEKSECDNACFSLVEAYKNGSLAVSGIISLGENNSFAIESNDNFSWNSNTADTNPDIELHEDFIKRCSSKADIKIDSENAKRLNVTFHSNNLCQKKFKLIASDPSPNTSSERNAPDPFASPLQASAQETASQNSPPRTPASAPTSTNQSATAEHP